MHILRCWATRTDGCLARRRLRGATSGLHQTILVGVARGLLLPILIAGALFPACFQPASAEPWESIDRRVKHQVYQINVGLKLRLPDGQFALLSDVSQKHNYPVFASLHKDIGYRVVGFGTAFPVRTSRATPTYFLTNRHVVASGVQIIEECQRFYAAMRLFAQQTAGSDSSAEERLAELQKIARMPQEKTMSTSERAVYSHTMDSIWDCYETYLSRRVDSARILFDRYKKLIPVTYELGYFLHPPGPVTTTPLQGHIYRIGKKPADPDLAILTVKSTSIPALELDIVSPSEGQEVQVIGYPVASDQIDADAGQYYAPTFNTGRISRITPGTLQVDAPVTTGNSGGPVVNQSGRVVGVVRLRARDSSGKELPNFGGAIPIQKVRSFAPELFGNLTSSQ